MSQRYSFTNKEMAMIIYCIEKNECHMIDGDLRERFKLYCKDYNFDNPVEEYYANAD